MISLPLKLVTKDFESTDLVNLIYEKTLKIKNVFLKKCTTEKRTFEQGTKIKLSRERKK